MGVLSLPAPHPSVGLFLARQLAILREGTNPSLIGANILADTGVANSQGDLPATAFYPRGWWVRETGRTYIFISGSENLNQAAKYVDVVSHPLNAMFGGQPNRNYFTDATDNYLNPYCAPDVGQTGTILFAGHSLGGTFAQFMVSAARARNIRSAQAAVTFGSPKFVRRQELDVFAGGNITRWMNNNDPVPHCPPGVVTNIAALAGLFPFALENWSNTAQLAGGVSVAHDGVTDDVPVPPLGTINIAASLANWLWDIYSQRETVHDLPEYVRRLINVETRVAPPMSAVVHDSGPERPLSLDRRSASRAIDDGIQTIIHAGRVQNEAILAVPPARAFRPVKIGPIWWVTFGGQLVAVGPRRRNVGLMCVRGNEFLRRLQRMAGVDGNALSRLLIQYIEEASIEGNGWTPPIKRLD